MTTTYTIYGKPSCPQCDQAKNILASKGIEFVYLVLDQDYTKEELVSICPFPPRMLPQVFKELGGASVYVGSINELKKDIE